jgi:hypothetical protein
MVRRWGRRHRRELDRAYKSRMAGCVVVVGGENRVKGWRNGVLALMDGWVRVMDGITDLSCAKQTLRRR